VQEYRRKKRTLVTAVRLDLETKGFEYQKWGGTQRCKPGDWLVNNQGDVYTVDAESFDLTYKQSSPGVYEKTASVWAKQAAKAGAIQTKEGLSSYQRGDYLVFNDPDGNDGYAMPLERFRSLYVLRRR